ncbi:hypothetical protein GYMLUDRAFT_244860 [Collybiopsis luxurians FD-317 M1]|uniref:Uncharacterized protein n=1 Tax=Collybiopsis luxurians FD-317 M1 TaxID=944289 RepID=A0A0D0CN34_9AGAR|nr:hypothetical protein GYMLUDRAFT_244860 [Collybiopsis luxurians FD-317 M1]
MANGSSLKFLRIYDTLPPEAQKSLVDSQLGSLLNSLPKEKAKRVVSAATRLQKRYASIPDIDVKSKKKEIRTLLNDLRRDNKRSFLKDRSNRTEIHAEVIDTLACWIEQIWRVVYEHNVHFVKAHNALLYIANLILEIRDISGHGGGCKCSVVAIPVSVKIKSTSGKLIKRFSYPNIQSMDKVLLWLWRELFVSMSASGGRQARKKISEMLVDIEDTFGWKSLAKVLHGGYNALAWALNEDDGEDNDDDEGSIFSDDSLGDESCLGSSSDCDTDASSSLSTSSTPDRCTCSLHAHHWSSKVNKQRHHLRTLVVSYLRTLFELDPSPNLYISIIELSDEPELTSIELLDTLSDIATSSSSAFASTLAIYASEGDAREIVKLLDTHAHLLRPQDASSYQAAVVTMAEDEVLDKGGKGTVAMFRTRALKIIETELMETVRGVRNLVFGCFKSLDVERNRSELKRVLKMQVGSQARKDRIASWIDAVVAPPPVLDARGGVGGGGGAGAGGGGGAAGVAGGGGGGGAGGAGDGIPPPLHPIAFAAMMMGFPVPVPLNGGDIDENDPDTDEGGPFGFGGMGMGMGISMGMGGMGLLDMDPDDPDLDDVREELRPRLKERFEGWVEAAMKIKGGPGVLAKVYTRMVSEEEKDRDKDKGKGKEGQSESAGQSTTVTSGAGGMGMTWLQGADVVDAMINRLGDRPSRDHITDALEAMGNFAKIQRKKKVLRQSKKASGAGGAGKNQNANANVNGFQGLGSGSGSGSGITTRVDAGTSTDTNANTIAGTSASASTNANANTSGSNAGTPHFSFSFGRNVSTLNANTNVVGSSTSTPFAAPSYGGLDDVD